MNKRERVERTKTSAGRRLYRMDSVSLKLALIVLLFVSALFQAPYAVMAAETITVPDGNTAFINEDFETTTDPPVTGTTSPMTTVAGFTPTITASDAYGLSVSDNSGTAAPTAFPSRALLLKDTGTGSVKITKSFAAVTGTVLSVEQDMYFEGPVGNGSTPLQILGTVNGSSSSSDLLIEVALKNSNIAWRDSGGTATANYHNISTTAIAAKTWYHLKAVLNLSTYRVNYYLTKPDDPSTSYGTLLDQPFFNAATTSAVAKSYLATTSGSSSAYNVAFDNVQVYRLNAVPDRPAGVTAIAGNTQVAIWWAEAKNATTYDLLRGTSDTGPFTAVAAGLTAAPTQSSPFNDAHLTNGTTYYYVVRALNVYGSTDSAPLAVVPTGATPLPLPPSDIAATARDSAVTLAWNEVGDAATYTLKRSTSLEGPYSTLSSALPSSQTSYYDTGLNDGTTYYYKLSSQNIAGIGTESEPVTVTPVAPFAAPSGLKAAAGHNRVTLSWDPAAGAVSYTVKRSSVSGGPYTIVASGVTVPGYTDTAVSDGTAYYYTVSAESGQTESMNAKQVRAIPSDIPSGAPSAPTGGKISAAPSRVSLSWDAVSGASGYIVKRAAAYDGPYGTLAVTAGTAYSDTGVTNGTTYYYIVTASIAGGESEGTQPLIATPSQVIVVAQDGAGDYVKIQDAINAIPSNNKTRIVIYIRNGFYKEKLVVPADKPYISFVGESREGTVLSYDNSVGANPNTQVQSFDIRGANATIEKVTIQNTAFPRTAPAPGFSAGQALALYLSGDKFVVRDVTLLGYQDTLYISNGRQYFHNVLIEGDVDYIYGNGVAYFDRAELKHVGKAGGHTTAASTDQGMPNGYVIADSRLTRGTSSLKSFLTAQGNWDSSWDIDANGIPLTNNTVDLGRPWRPYGHVKYINTWMDAHIKPQGWDNWGNPANELTAVYAEYASSGPGANPKGRFAWSKQLTSGEADELTVQRVLGGADSWDPTLTGVFAAPVPGGIAVPAAPGGLKAEAGDKRISLTWNNVTGAEQYTVKRSTASGGPYEAIANVSDARFTDTGLMNGTTYYYVVTAGNAAGESADSAQASTKPVQPGVIVKAEVTAPTTVKLTLGQKLTTFVPSDFELSGAMGTWYSLNANLSNKYFTVKRATAETNAEGNTVVVIETDQPINPDATITVPVTENPKSVPYLSTAYYSGDRAKDIQQAEYLLGWQMDHGGWFKFSGDKYKRAWDGKEAKADWKSKDGKDLGTIDNNATTNEILFLSVMYKETGDVRYKEAAQRGVEFLLKMQYPSGGWAQVYPARGNYSDYVTYNDNAMMRVMNVLTMAVKKQYPFNTDILDDGLRSRLQQSLNQGLDYILKSQIVVDGVPAAWCAQHDPVTYEPRGARAYEHPSISGSESIDIMKYLMALPNPSPEVKRAVDSALSWFDANKVSGMKYVSGDPNNVYFVPDPNSTIWYRFYEIGTNLPIFSGRDGVIKHNILEIEGERRNGYSWAGTWPQKLLTVAGTTGFFENRAYVKIVGDQSQTASGAKWTVGEVKRVEGTYTVTIPEAPSGVTAEAGSGGQTALAWNSVTDAVYYNVKRSLTSGGPYTAIGTNLRTASYIDMAAADGNTYYYVVTAANTAGESMNSGEVGVDKTAPVTIAAASAATGSNGWHTSSPTITLSARDDFSGIKQTLYRLNQEAWEPYSQPVTITADGIHTLEYKSVDQAGNEESLKSMEVKVDKTSPVVHVTLDKNTLWPPNHKLITVTASVYATDSASQIDSIVLTSITSSEPDSGLGDGDESGDIQDAQYGTFDVSFALRAERPGKSGRIYTITYTATEKAGNQTIASATVQVPHDQSGKDK
ncbi:pectate lyase [Paenibacillus allorhizosphaerae]|uniref:Fibronectin type-III domain-containing protein n=1 Tax=Paenibacillus allorhizosphaerae TaxID=2849866 RepID=A0ABM8VIT5_9BACL|nr:pectate lyase [Paenibacillus allorhizosphaerae]CAG7644431.1 hypothetical protein PAECIP111802_03264 [Paenibacillus allorhizosphaerae]